MQAEVPSKLMALSHEVMLRCDQRGVVTWCDSRAAERIGARAGRPFVELAVPGTEAAAERFLDEIKRDAVVDQEVALLVDGKPSTVRFSSALEGDDAALLGLLVPRHFADAMSQIGRAMNEIVGLNRQISTQKRELSERNDELTRANTKLSESNQGVLSLHAELQDKSLELERQAEIKARVVANVSHEFRTPLHAILGLSKLLLDGTDGPLMPEQITQVQFIRSSCEELLTMVNDILDLTKVEAGKASLRAEKFPVTDLFASLRGMLRPTFPEESTVKLLIEPPADEIDLDTDRAKLAQVLRNLITNALKFTEKGEVRVTAERCEPEGIVRFRVSDTGIGIKPEDIERIFEEFTQVEGHLQRPGRGTGLGLPLSRRLAELLGGVILVESSVGRGSVFTVEIPTVHPEVSQMARLEKRSQQTPPGPSSILVVEDDRKTIFIYDKFLSMAGFHVVPVRSTPEARAFLKHTKPAAIVLDIMLENESSWDLLSELKSSPETADIPVLVVTVTNREHKARALGADEFWLKPIDQDRLLRKIRALSRVPSRVPSVLVIDDDERARYLIRSHLRGTGYTLLEASSGPDGVAKAREHLPDVILLDFFLENATAFDVLDELKAEPQTRSIPVIIVTSHVLDSDARSRLLTEAEAVISKESLSRELALNRIRDALRKAQVHPRPERAV